MISKQEIEDLAKLSRISLTEDEKDKIQKDLDAVLEYISQLKNAPVLDKEVSDIYGNKNVFREDENPHSGGEYTDDILKNAPKVKDGYISVKQIIGEKGNK